MMKQTFTLLLLLCLSAAGYSQILFSEDFNSVSLVDQAAKLPGGWIVQNRDGQIANAGERNTPFNQSDYRYDAWAVTDYSLNGEIAVVSTALHGPVDNITDRWLISPKVSGIKAASHLFWRGFTDNDEALDKCEIWVTSTIAGAAPNADDFLADNSQKLGTFKMNPNEFNEYAQSLGSFDGQDIYFAIRNTSFIPARVYLDDFVIKDALENDIQVKSLTMPTYILSGVGPISVQVVSKSRTPVTSITLKYQVDGAGDIETETFAVNLPIVTNAVEVSFDKWANFAQGGHDIQVWVDKVNGMPDANEDDNSKEGFVSALNDPPLKRVLIQEYTGAWCGWCPAGTVVLDQITKGDPTFVPVAIHSGDAMDFDESLEIAGLATSAYPSASFDFALFEGETKVAVSRDTWFNRALERLEAIVPVELEIESHSYNRDTREMEVTVKGNFIGAAKDDLRLNVWVIEEDVTGPLDEVGNNQWNNANYDDTNPASPFFGLGPYLEPHEFQHEHVFNATLTGAWGDPDIFPASIVPGQSFSKTYTYTLPTATGDEHHWKAEDIHIVAFVSHFELNPQKRYILNAARSLTFLTDVKEPAIAALTNMRISPNPVSAHTLMSIDLLEASDLQISIFNAMGQKVKTMAPETFPSGKSTKALYFGDMAPGIYWVSLNNEEGAVYTKRVLVQR